MKGRQHSAIQERLAEDIIAAPDAMERKTTRQLFRVVVTKGAAVFQDKIFLLFRQQERAQMFEHTQQTQCQ